MASYRCACCCPDRNHSRRSRSRAQQHIPMNVFRLTQHSYQRISRENSTILNNQQMSMSYEDEGSNIVSEFDYRQCLHMECGVVALEPPPPYTAAVVKTAGQQSTREGAASEEQVEGEERNYDSVQCIHQGSRNTIPPPPYEERDRARRIRNLVSKAVGRFGGRRNNEVIALRTLSTSESSNSSENPDVTGGL